MDELARMLVSRDDHLRNVGDLFFKTHFWLLLEHQLLTPRIIGYLAVYDFDFFMEHFHFLKSAGFVNQKTLEAFIFCPLAATSRNELGQLSALFDVVKKLGESEEWLSSPLRWKSLKEFLSFAFAGVGQFSFRGLPKHIFQELRIGGDTINPEDLARLLTALTQLSDEDIGYLDKEIPRLTQKDSFFLTESGLKKTAEFFGVTEDPIYKAAQAKIGEEKGERFLWEWTLIGLDEAWVGYRQASEEEIKNKRKLFLNFLKQNLKRTPPTLCRLITKRANQAAEERFVSAAEVDKQFLSGPVWNHFKKSPLYLLFIKASRFLEPEGMASLQRLLFGLRVERGRLVYPRYEELKGVVHETFLNEWRKDVAVDLKNLPSLDAESGKRALKAQVVAQVRGHLIVQESLAEEEIPEVIRLLPSQVRQWLEDFSATEEWNGEYAKRAKALGAAFESYYHDIRKYFGDAFANIRTDLRNFTVGITKGAKQAQKSERFVVAGGVEQIARSGSEPVHTCQTLEFAWVNQKGEPIHRMLHGQFKVANWEIDGSVMARRLLEVTVDEERNEHLLVERLYNVGGFGRVAEFRTQILQYAGSLGIEESRVHFSDEDSLKTAPKVLETGDPIYRDSFQRLS